MINHAWHTPFWMCCNRPGRCLHYPMFKLIKVPMHRTEPHIVLKCWWLPVANLLRKVLDLFLNRDVLQTACVALASAGKLHSTRLRMHAAMTALNWVQSRQVLACKLLASEGV